MRSWLNAQRSKASNVGGDVYHLLSRCRGETSGGLPVSLFFIPRENLNRTTASQGLKKTWLEILF